MAIRKTVKKDAAVETAKVAETPVAVKAEAAAPKAEKAAPVKAEKAPAKKAAAPKAPKAPKAVKAAPVAAEVYVQYGVMEWKAAELTEMAKAAYTAAGNTDAVASVKLYIKPEERKAYYVINDTATGSIEL